MINAHRRGAQEAGEEVKKHPTPLPLEAIMALAGQVLVRLKQANYAHLEPDQEFIAGFTANFTYLQNASSFH